LFLGTGKNFQNLTTGESHTTIYLPAQESREMLPTFLPQPVILVVEMPLCFGFGFSSFAGISFFAYICAFCG